MTNEDLDLMIEVLAVNYLADVIPFEDTGISPDRMAKFVQKIRSNEYVVDNDIRTTSRMANEVLNRILERNGL